MHTHTHTLTHITPAAARCLAQGCLNYPDVASCSGDNLCAWNDGTSRCHDRLCGYTTFDDLNGRPAGQSTAGPSAWNSAFEIDITEHLRPGQPNDLVVRVHNAVGPGGIWKSVKIFTHKN